MAQIPIFYMNPMLPSLRSIQLIGMYLFFKIKEVRVDLLPQNHENGHFSTKNGQKKAQNGLNSHFFYMDPMLPWLRSIQLIGMRLFFRVKEVRVDLLPQNHENGHFQQQKMAKKWP